MPEVKKIGEIYVPVHALKEAMKAEVELKKVKFPRELGEEHPFPFKMAEDTCCRSGFARAAVDKHLDFMFNRGFHVRSDVKRAEKLINDFIIKESFLNILRQWAGEGLTKGNGFLEVSVDTKEIQTKVVNANSMYVDRDKKGKLKGYNQYVGSFDKFDIRKTIPFTPQEIAHVAFNRVGDDAYGYGIIYAALRNLDNLLRAEKDMHILIQRKANTPIHAKLGTPEEPATGADVSAFGVKLEYLNNVHEWATDHRVEFKTIDFGNIGDKFDTILNHDLNMLFYIFQIPAVLMGMANIPEGLAKVQMDAFERRIQSYQEIIEKVIEEQIFKPILNMNGLDAHVEIEWSQPSEESTNQRVAAITMLLNNPFLQPALKSALEIDLATTLGYEDAVKVMIKPKEAADLEAERQAEGELEQPEIPGQKPTASEAAHIHETVNSNIKLSEWVNFDFEQYRKEVIDFVLKDPFSDLLAKNAKEQALGKLSQNQVDRLKGVLVRGFKEDLTLFEIEKDVQKLKLKDRYTDVDGKKRLAIAKEDRPMVITRTETTRAAAGGVLNNYEKKGINKVRFLSSVSDRTCPICEDLNGRVFNLNESYGIIPVHTGCRCTWLAVTE